MTLVLLAGIFLGFYALFCVYKGYESQKWPTTDGRIIYSRVVGSTRIIGRKASIKYEYVVDGKRYISSLISYTWKSVDYQAFMQILQEYPESEDVIVHYNPRDPQEAVLKTDIARHIFWLFLFSALVILIGVNGVRRRIRSAEVETAD
jgi:hypothetical protein